MSLRDVDGEQTQKHTDQYTLLDLLHSADPPVPGAWVKNHHMFNALNLPKQRDELERVPMWR